MTFLNKLRQPNIAQLLIASIALVLAICPSSGLAQSHSLASTQPHSQAAHSSEFGGFFAGGFVPAYEVHSPWLRYGVKLELYNAGLQFGRMVTGIHGKGLFRGRGEAMLEVIPFWLAHYPKQNEDIHFRYENQPYSEHSIWGPYSLYGASITPFLLRWNFESRENSRRVPWLQLGGGLLWTNHKFPLLGGSTSVINFTPQVDLGEDFFVRRNRSVNLAIKAVHISNAGLGDNNPGLNVTLQFSAGFSWWK